MRIQGKYTSAEIFTDNVEPECLNQLYKIVNDENYNNPIKIMPDCHSGKGAVVGFTMELDKTLNPEIIGVDIGCGVDSIPFYVEDRFSDKDLSDIDRQIRDIVPMGFEVNKKGSTRDLDAIYKKCQDDAMNFCKSVKLKYGVDVFDYMPNYNHGWAEDMVSRIGASHKRVGRSIGTLGGGNHFIELGISGNMHFLTIHSGSRNLGHKICDYYTNDEPTKEIARASYLGELEFVKDSVVDKSLMPKVIEDLKKKYKVLSSSKNLSGEYKARYIFDMIFAQNYAMLNRKVMIFNIMSKVTLFKDVFSNNQMSSVHNYINFNDMIIRKGAISAHSGEVCLIPFNMRDGILVGVGKGNPDWNYSAPHGAGRIMSRTKAKEVLSVDEAKKQMEGIYTSEIPIDEAPNAYKDSAEIENAIKDTVDIKYKIKPILNIKSK